MLSAISVYEIGQMVRTGKWPEMAADVGDLEALIEERGITVAPLTASLSLLASLLEWDHRDPFDRVIAVVALQERVAVVSSDPAFDAVGVERVW